MAGTGQMLWISSARLESWPFEKILHSDIHRAHMLAQNPPLIHLWIYTAWQWLVLSNTIVLFSELAAFTKWSMHPQKLRQGQLSD